MTPVPFADLNLSSSSAHNESFHSTFTEPSPRSERCSTPLPKAAATARSSVEEHEERAKHRNASNSNSNSPTSEKSQNAESRWQRINRFAQMIARDEILDADPRFFFNSHDETARATMKKVLDSFGLDKLLQLVRKQMVAVELQPKSNSPFSRDVLMRILCDDMISPELWQEQPVWEKIKKHVQIKASTQFHIRLKETQNVRKVSNANYPNNMKGWQDMEDYLLAARDQQIQEQNAVNEENSSIFDYPQSQSQPELRPMEPPSPLQSPNAYSSPLQ